MVLSCEKKRAVSWVTSSGGSKGDPSADEVECIAQEVNADSRHDAR
jgi:hypothetical protein